MWRFIFIEAIFISAFFHSSGEVLFDYEQLIAPYLDCPAADATSSAGCVVSKRYCSATELTGVIPDSSLATFGCLPGFTHDNVQNLCIRKEDRGAPVMGCPTECYEKDGQCMRTTSVKYFCPSHVYTGCSDRGYLHHGKSCVNGYRRDGEACIYEGANTDVYHCPIGTLIDGSERCLTNEVCSNRFHCKIGDLENNKCMETVKRSPEWLCNQGSLKFRCLQGTKRRFGPCTDTKMDPVLTCLANYSRVSTGDQCQRDCPDDYHRIPDEEGCVYLPGGYVPSPRPSG